MSLKYKMLPFDTPRAVSRGGFSKKSMWCSGMQFHFPWPWDRRQAGEPGGGWEPALQHERQDLGDGARGPGGRGFPWRQWRPQQKGLGSDFWVGQETYFPDGMEPFSALRGSTGVTRTQPLVTGAAGVGRRAQEMRTNPFL